MKISGLLLALIVFSSVTHAQVPLFFVSAIKGEPLIIRPGHKAQRLTAKSFVFQNEFLKIIDNSSQVSLINNEGQIFVISRQGTIKSSDIKNVVKGKSLGITRKFFQLIWKDIYNPDSPITNKDDVIDSWGGGDRDVDNCVYEVYPLDGQKITADSIKFKWISTGKKQNYTIEIFDDDNHVIFKKNVIDTELTVKNISWEPGSHAHTDFYYCIHPDSSNCPFFQKLNFLYRQQKRQIKKFKPFFVISQKQMTN